MHPWPQRPDGAPTPAHPVLPRVQRRCTGRGPGMLARALASVIGPAVVLVVVAGWMQATAADAGLDPFARHLEPNALARRHAVVLTYAGERHREYQAIVTSAVALQQAITALCDAPSDATMQAARQAWSACHLLYSPSECHRFYGGPIDEPRADLENKINAWPIDESCIDAVSGDPAAGVINQPGRYPEITPEVLVNRNRSGGEKNVSIGFHAIEFLLWGQGLEARGPGVRSWKDYLPGGGAARVERRAAYLRVIAGLLVDHLTAVDRQWDPDVADNYRARFVSGDVNAALRKIVTGLAALSGDELAAERMAVAYESHSMEDGQSCFSFTTRDDLIANLAGIRATYLGPGAPGVGLSDLIQASDPDLDTRIRHQLALSAERMQAIPAPFGLSIQGDDSAPGRRAIRAAIEALEPQRQMLIHAARTLGILIQLGKDPDHALKTVEVDKPD